MSIVNNVEYLDKIIIDNKIYFFTSSNRTKKVKWYEHLLEIGDTAFLIDDVLYFDESGFFNLTMLLCGKINFEVR